MWPGGLRPSPEDAGSSGRVEKPQRGAWRAVQREARAQPAGGAVPRPPASAAPLCEGPEAWPWAAACSPARVGSGAPSASRSALTSGCTPLPGSLASRVTCVGEGVAAQVRGALAGTERFLNRARVLFADWRDPAFLRDVEAATGADLGSARAGGRGRGKRRRHPGLTDLKQQSNTARTRIAKKIFAK